MEWHARLIAPAQELDSAPLLRTEFRLERGHGELRRATLFITAQGVFEAWLNGRSVSNDLLSPGWTAYEWRLRYARHDVTDLIEQTSVLGIALGRGWFGGRLGFLGGGEPRYGDGLGVFAQLELEFVDGSRQLVVTDEGWSAGPSEILANDLYDGETIDARRRDDAWKRPSFDGEGWAGVRSIEFDTDRLVPYIGPPVSRWATLPVRNIWSAPSGATLVDFGQNLVGWVRVQVQGPAGSEIVIRHAEVLENGELGVRPLRSAQATDRYILSGGADQFEPTFTFHGFRYAEITGWPGELRAEDLAAVAIGSELIRIGEFRTSDEMINRLHENIVWGMRGNFVDVPTDCPQRDERLGWTGDIAAFAPTAAFLYDVDAFLSDWLVDLDVEQRHNNGIVPFVIPDVMKRMPEAVAFGTPESTAIWSDAAVWVPWALYQAYGDSSVLARQFESMTSHVRRVQSLLSSSGVWDANFQFGDWLDPDAPPDDPAAAKAHTGVVATACAYRSARIVSEAAAVLGRSAEQEEFAVLAQSLRTAFNREYVDEGIVESDCTTVYSLAIAFDLLSGAHEAVAGDRLAELAADAGYRISTGFAGTPFITDALTRTGHVDVAYRLLLEPECPSWMYPVTMGATTVWERWDSMLPDGTINPGEMTSFNHYALGAVADWMHRVIGGLSALEPGYGRVLVAPRPGGGLTEARTALETPHGRVLVHWQVDGEDFSVHVELPDGVDGVLRLPDGHERQIRSGRSSASSILSSVG